MTGTEREDLARACDPAAFEHHPSEARRAFAAIQWGARRHQALEVADRLLASDWLEAVKREAVLDYVTRKEIPKIMVEFTNQPTFDGVIREAKAKALIEAAASIPERMRLDELGMHQVLYSDELPQLSQVMLNGATRFAERLTERAAEYHKTSEGSES